MNKLKNLKVLCFAKIKKKWPNRLKCKCISDFQLSNDSMKILSYLKNFWTILLFQFWMIKISKLFEIDY